MTAAGHVEMRRRTYACRHCHATYTPVDEWAGVDKGHLTVGAKPLVCLGAMSWSFDRASRHLLTFTGLTISDQTIRRVAEAEGVKIQAWQETSSQATGPVACAEGNAEFLTDGTMVNTRQGWQETRVSIFSKRPPGASADPASFTGLDDRALPKPAAQLVLVSKQDRHAMGELWSRVATRLGWERGKDVSAISDGAGWIAAEEERVLPLAQRVVDVYHVSEHLHRCAGVLHGERTDAARAWAAARLIRLVREGAAVLLWGLEQEARGATTTTDRVAPEEQARAAASPSARAALDALVNYLRSNEPAIGYADRRRRGEPIGSGQVEGACKTVVGRRLKLNSARWSPSNIAPVASLCALDHSNLWDAYLGRPSGIVPEVWTTPVGT